MIRWSLNTVPMFDCRVVLCYTTSVQYSFQRLYNIHFNVGTIFISSPVQYSFQRRYNIHLLDAHTRHYVFCHSCCRCPENPMTTMPHRRYFARDTVEPTRHQSNNTRQATYTTRQSTHLQQSHGLMPVHRSHGSST